MLSQWPGFHRGFQFSVRSEFRAETGWLYRLPGSVRLFLAMADLAARAALAAPDFASSFSGLLVSHSWRAPVETVFEVVS